MHQRQDAWQHLNSLVERHDVDAALLQEAKRPEQVRDGWRVDPPADDERRWRLSVPPLYRAADGTTKPTRRPFGSSIVATGGRTVVPRVPVELHQSVDGELACSHPGQFAVADLRLDDGAQLTIVSLYGIWERMTDSGALYIDATLHRAISDLAIVFQQRASSYVLVGGDLNLYSYSDGSAWSDRAMAVLSRLALYGLELCGPFRPDSEDRLERCPCPDVDCRHVNTFLFQSKPANRPHQVDFFLATPKLRERLVDCWADADPAWHEHSDHRAIFATFDL